MDNLRPTTFLGRTLSNSPNDIFIVKLPFQTDIFLKYLGERVVEYWKQTFFKHFYICYLVQCSFTSFYSITMNLVPFPGVPPLPKQLKYFRNNIVNAHFLSFDRVTYLVLAPKMVPLCNFTTLIYFLSELTQTQKQLCKTNTVQFPKSVRVMRADCISY